ncbi:MAG: hypothetical protein A49_26970 [Methyloceanibacter sp.]|nr:MAG: hypothetical protein A49_26970 [Methyloceanibacter sp.]
MPQRRVLEGRFRFFRKAEPHHAPLAEFGQGFRQIAHLDDGHEIERAACGFGKDAAEGRAVALGHDQPRRAEGGRRAERGAHIVGIGNLIQHEQRSREVELIQGERIERPRLQKNALMHRVRAELPVQCPRKHAFGLKPALRDEGRQPVRGVLGRAEGINRALLVGERGLDGVQTEEQNPLRVMTFRGVALRAASGHG